MSKQHGGHTALKLVGSRYESLGVARGRLVFLSFVFAVAFMVVGIRLGDLMLMQGEFAAIDRGDMDVGYVGLLDDAAVGPVTRGDIVDRNGKILATSLRVASLYADPLLVQDTEGVADQLALIFDDLDRDKALGILARENRFAWVKRHITPEQQARVLEIGSPGLSFKKEYRRFYPHGAMSGHVVGYTNVDGKGLAGIERAYDERLSTGSEPVRLTLDVRVQHVVHRVLQHTVQEFSAVGGAAAVLDVRDGSVLAAVSLPDYDPHAPLDAPLVESATALFNRLTQGTYELGSTFKIFSTAAFLELVGGSFREKFDAREPIEVAGFKISDYHAEERILTLPEVFMVSSNIGSALMAQRLGTEKFKQFYDDLGLLSRVPFDIKEVATPQVPFPWRDVNTLTAAYGHGIAVTPLQLVSAASSIVNGGFVVKPFLVADSENAQAKKKSIFDHDVRIVSAQTSHRLRQLMRLVVTDGTGGNAEVKGYQVGGKTGTAQKVGASGGYDSSKRISSFLGFFPMDDPEYAVFVMVDEPKGISKTFNYATGGWVAAPDVQEIVQVIGPMLGVSPRDDAVTKKLTEELKQYISVKDIKE